MDIENFAWMALYQPDQIGYAETTGIPEASMRRRATVSPAEQDAFGSWGRRFMCYIQRAGTRSSIKNGAIRRERREAKARIRRGEDN
ncbi:MAG TPA: hypothetical protein VGG75_38230 [Trebonia sp.]|jgi:hypothetical protein